jgi:hypothetical protein
VAANLDVEAACGHPGISQVGRRSAGAGPPLASRDQLLLAADAGLLIVLATANLGEDPVLLDLLVETTEGTLKCLAFANFDFGQSESPPSFGLRDPRIRACGEFRRELTEYIRAG